MIGCSKQLTGLETWLALKNLFNIKNVYQKPDEEADLSSIMQN